eukprot:31476-Pelagococcus_subviridis.AAC.22
MTWNTKPAFHGTTVSDAASPRPRSSSRTLPTISPPPPRCLPLPSARPRPRTRRRCATPIADTRSPSRVAPDGLDDARPRAIPPTPPGLERTLARRCGHDYNALVRSRARRLPSSSRRRRSRATPSRPGGAI